MDFASFTPAKASDQGVVCGLATGFIEAFRQELDGARQLSGSKIEDSHIENSATESIGKFAGTATIYTGATILAKRVPGKIAGEIALMAAGGVLGFVAPVKEQQGMRERLINGAVGATTMGLIVHGPAIIERIPGLSVKLDAQTLTGSIGRVAISNAVAGAIQTDGTALVNTGHHASWDELTSGAATWATMGSILHGISSAPKLYRFTEPNASAVNASTFENTASAPGKASFDLKREMKPELQATFDEIMPPPLREALAKRSPMFSPERATKFARDLEEALPNSDETLQHEYRVVAAAVDKTRAWNRFKSIEETVQPVVDRTARESGFPPPRFGFYANMSSRGSFRDGWNSIWVNPAQLKVKGDFAATSYHELTHAEQVNVVTRKLADDLSIGADATPEQKALLHKTWIQTFGIDEKSIDYRAAIKQRLEKYLVESLELRNGEKLTPAQEQRATELIASFSRKGDRYFDAMKAHPGSSGLPAHRRDYLLYRSSLHEMEAWEVVGLI